MGTRAGDCEPYSFGDLKGIYKLLRSGRSSGGSLGSG